MTPEQAALVQRLRWDDVPVEACREAADMIEALADAQKITGAALSDNLIASHEAKFGLQWTAADRETMRQVCTAAVEAVGPLAGW